MLSRPSVAYRMLQIEARRLRAAQHMAPDRRASVPARRPTTSSSSAVAPVASRSRTAWPVPASAAAQSSRETTQPGGMFRRFPVYERLISWTKPDAPCRARNPRVRVVRPQQPPRRGRREPSARSSPRFMDRDARPPGPCTRWRRRSRSSPHAATSGSATDAEWESTRSEDDGFVLVTSDGEYRCRACVFALGMTEPWRPPIPGLDEAPHYADTRSPKRYEGRSVFIVGKRNSGFEVAEGLLPWARGARAGLTAPGGHRSARVLTASRCATCSRSTSTCAAARGATSSTPRSSAIERHDGGYRIRAHGTTWHGRADRSRPTM